MVNQAGSEAGIEGCGSKSSLPMLQEAGTNPLRAAFGADWSRLQQALADGPKRAIDKLLRPEGDVAEFNRTYEQYDAAGEVIEQFDVARGFGDPVG